jgi:hypothetical protein
MSSEKDLQHEAIVKLYKDAKPRTKGPVPLKPRGKK